MQNNERLTRMNKMSNGDRDILTGIYNRDGFCFKVKELFEQNPDSDYVVAAWDIEKFKVINELYGTVIGDRILRSFQVFLQSFLISYHL